VQQRNFFALDERNIAQNDDIKFTAYCFQINWPRQTKSATDKDNALFKNIYALIRPPNISLNDMDLKLGVNYIKSVEW